jgi:hypothetical protein
MATGSPKVQVDERFKTMLLWCFEDAELMKKLAVVLKPFLNEPNEEIIVPDVEEDLIKSSEELTDRNGKKRNRFNVHFNLTFRHTRNNI